MKICLVTSNGGHLAQLFILKPWWSEYERFWVTFDKVDSRSILEGENTYYAYSPTNRSVKNLIRNLFLAVKILLKERPDVIFSSGAGVAVPFFWVGKLLGAKLVYIESFDRINSSTMTGRLVYPITNKFLVQWDDQLAFYPKGEYWGQTF